MFQTFELEHYQSLYERTVRYNLADSSVQCVTLPEWLEPADREALLRTDLYYPEVNGTTALRQRIAALYAGATADNVLVTVGAAQANSMVAQTLIQAGDEVVVMSPGYRQIWGLARNLGATVREIRLDPDNGWRLDLDQALAQIGPQTRLVALVNPNNPTGTVLSDSERAALIAACARVGAWLHVDEVYLGTEHNGVETRSFWGDYDRLIVSNSLSKAYGLAGLRIGWVVAAPEMVEELWRRHEYAAIAAAGPSMVLAEIALRPERRAALFVRQRALTAGGFQLLDDWIAEHPTLVSRQGGEATSIAFVRYHLDRPSGQVADAIRQQGDVLVAPGAMMGADGHLRITVGYAAEKIAASLDRIGAVLRTLA